MADFGDNSPKNEKGEPFGWPEYLEFNGYRLDRMGHVEEMDEVAVANKRREYQ